MKTNKFTYLAVIQQQHTQGWEDVTQYETNSSYIPLEYGDPDKKGKKRSQLKIDLQNYRRETTYPTRVIYRREKIGNSNPVA